MSLEWVGGEAGVDYDEGGDALYVYRSNESACSGCPDPDDTYLILRSNGAGKVVGITLTAAREMPPEFWVRHPSRCRIPADILVAVDEWIIGGGWNRQV